jgi:uroporphyrinogen-III synthase
LVGRRIVVTRAADQAGGLAAQLAQRGATVVNVPVIELVDPLDGGAALRSAVADLDSVDWVVLTSANGARRFCTAVGNVADRHRVPRIAAVGPATAAVLHDAGWNVDLIPAAAVAESLAEEFPRGDGVVVLIRPEVARDVVAPALRAKGWTVNAVVAYRNVATQPSAEQLAAVTQADVVTFTSSSTVRRLMELLDGAPLPPVVASIGPITSATARDAGIGVTVEADPHTVDGLVAALCRWADG